MKGNRWRCSNGKVGLTLGAWCLVDLAIGLIAVNYPAREFGVSRHVRYSSGLLLSIRGIALTLLYVHSPLQQMP